ncbi:MAG: hypothetical protein IPM54_33185 [Polyangiaceae bacterium]|nr:hypothetical protein [Polyangiaceae bacterium]
MTSCNDDLTTVDVLPSNGVSPKNETKPKRATASKLYRASIVIGHAESTLRFDGRTNVDIDRRALLATIERRVSEKWTLQAAAGGIVTGMLKVGQDRHVFGPGWSAGISASYRAVAGSGWKPFVLVGGTLAFAGANTQGVKDDSPNVGYLAGDIRLSIVAGITYMPGINPYAVVRGFGGPIWWQIDGKDVVGTDRYKFQVGVGLAVAIPMGFDAFIEYIPAGERALSTGLGYSF